MSELATAVVSITRTARGRYFWAAWWTHAPRHAPFRKPDASNGGAPSAEAAHTDAERTCARHLSPISPYWARAWNRMLRGEQPPPPPLEREALREQAQPDAKVRAQSSWEILGLRKGATLAEIKRAHRERALATHPDRGGDADAFLRVQRAYERLTSKRRTRRAP